MMRAETSGVLGLLATMSRLMVVLGVALCGGWACGDGARPGPGVEDALGPVPDVSVAADAGHVNPSDLSCLEMIPLSVWTMDPSAIAMMYRVETCDGETVVLEPGAGESVFDYYTLTENGQSLSSEAVPVVERSKRQRAYVTLLLDFSASTRTVETEILASAQAFVERLLAASDRIWVGIEIFDGRAEPVTILRPTPSISELRTAIQGLAGYSDPRSDPASTNLNGAVVESVAGLRRWQDRVMARYDMGVVTAGYLVVFTDGRDSAARVSRGEAVWAVATAREASASGEGANLQTYAVALKGLDYTSEARRDLLAILGGDARWLYEGSLSELEGRFTELAVRISSQAEATHLLRFCSAARSGMRQVELAINSRVGTARTWISIEFSASGFSGGCIEHTATACADRECGGFNCGGCDDRTEQCDMATGRCLSECIAQSKCESESITTSLGYQNVCAPEELGTDVVRCGNTCADLDSDDRNCGECGTVCRVGQLEFCEAGACGCPEGLERCERQCRPSVWFEDKVAHCGACDMRCENGGSCAGGACVCPGGWTGPTCATSLCSVPCQNGGVCTGTDTCACPGGWTGETCETSLCSTPCANGGTCSGPSIFTCATGWGGPTCGDLPMVVISPGTFMMGSSLAEVGRVSSETPHVVTLTRPFRLGVTEVRQGQWKAISGGVNPSHFSSCGDSCPVESVDWFSALAYANALSDSQGLQACYTLTGCADPANGWKDGQHSGCTGATFVGLDCTGYRLPTEAEWEYAARAGTTTATHAGNLSATFSDCTKPQESLDRIAWWCHNSDDRTRTVRSKAANAWGLYDMLGNVSEFTWDYHGVYPGVATDPLGPATGTLRVNRGGSYNQNGSFQRSAARGSIDPVRSSRFIGFRLARTVVP